MVRYSEEDQPQLQWLENMIDMLLRGFVSIFIVFGRTMKAAWSTTWKTKGD